MFAALSVSTVGAQEVESDDLFQLFNECNAIGLEVGRVSDDLLDLGISRMGVRALAESRLRVARLYAATTRTALHLAVSKHAIQVEYRKPVRDLVTGEARTLSTYRRSADVQGDTAPSVMLGLSNLLDLFLVEYLSVNESACGPPINHARNNEVINDAEPASNAQVGEPIKTDGSRLGPNDSSSEDQSAIAFDPQELATMAGYELGPVVAIKPLDTEDEVSVISHTRELAANRIRNFPNFLCEMVVERLRAEVRGTSGASGRGGAAAARSGTYGTKWSRRS